MEPREALRMHQQRNIIPGSYQDFLVNRHSDTIIQDLVKKLREASWMSGKRTRNVTFLGEQALASGARSKTRPAWQSLARPGFPGFWPSLPGKCGLVKPGKPGHGQVFLATLATKVRLSRPC